MIELERPIGVAALLHLLVRSVAALALVVISMPARAGCVASIIETPRLVAFEGCIDSQSAGLLIQALERHPMLPLLVKSEGGDAEAAIEAAGMMALLQTRLIIRDRCFSACATYWMPAAASVVVEEGSAIGFHGDIRTIVRHDPLLSTFGFEAQSYLALLLERETTLGKARSKVDDLHALQAIRRSKEPLRVYLRGQWQACPGLALSAVWNPTLRRLQALGFVNRIIPRDAALESLIAFGQDGHPMTAEDSDPAARCLSAMPPEQ